MPTVTALDPSQALRNSYDDASYSLRVNVVDAEDTGLNVQGSFAIPYTSINGSAGATYQIVASTTSNISIVVPNEQTGSALNLYTGPNGSETLLFIIAPGQDNQVNVTVPSGTRLSIRANGASAPSAGSCYLTFVG